MSDTILIEVGVKPHALDKPLEAEIELLASVLPELVLLMQRQIEDED
ncbi:hypothetical protein [uncultured Propionivibrio sp.]|nr:hypothetical protein [uncultured Propionivibrio sp.]